MIRFEMRILYNDLFTTVSTKAVRLIFIKLLLSTFVLTALHGTFHNPFDHDHDASCSVYVLEELFFGVDIEPVVLVAPLFIPFGFIPFAHASYRFLSRAQSGIRAPPCKPFSSL